MLPDDILGWDLGGAHLKVAHLDAEGRVLDVIQLPCPLWKGIDYLRHGVDEVLHQWGANTEQHAVTMTGELVDSFSTRTEGVRTLISVMEERLRPASIELFAGSRGFLEPCDSHKAEESIASSNWLASASFVAAPRQILLQSGTVRYWLVA